MTVLVTSATGNIGCRVVKRLLQAGQRPRIFIRNAENARFHFGGKVDVFVGDLAHAESLKPALAAVDALLLINSGPELAERDAAAAELAKTAGLKHIVKLSALSAAAQIAIGAWHANGESAVRASGVPCTMIRPAGFMSNTLEWARSIRAEGVVRACTGEGKVAYIHPDDVAEVTTRILLAGSHKGECVHITGPRAMSYAEMTHLIGAATGRDFRFEWISDETAYSRLTKSGMNVVEVEGLVAVWRAIREGHLSTCTNEVEKVLGRNAITFVQWAQENAEAFS